MKRIIMVVSIGLMMFMTGCKSTLYSVHPNESDNIAKYYRANLTNSQIEECHKMKSIYTEKYLRDKAVLKHYNILDKPEAIVLMDSWTRFIKIWDDRIESKTASRVDDVREVQYIEIIEKTRKDINKKRPSRQQ